MSNFDMFGNTSPHTLVRRQDPDTSHAAARSVDTTHLEGLVYATISKFGSGGCISDEVRSIHPTYPYSSITARYKALMTRGLIRDTGRRRPGRSGRGQRVMVAA